MKKLLLKVATGLILGFAPSMAVASACYEDTIQEVSSDGEILIMQSGRVYRVGAGDTVDSALWLPSDDVLICDDTMEIIDKDSSGEKVSATRIK